MTQQQVSIGQTIASNYKSTRRKKSKTRVRISREGKIENIESSENLKSILVSQVSVRRYNILIGIILILSAGSSLLVAGSVTSRGQQQLLGQPGREPRFGELDTESLQRIVVGRQAKFKCIVHDIGNHTVSIKI